MFSKTGFKKVRFEVSEFVAHGYFLHLLHLIGQVPGVCLQEDASRSIVLDPKNEIDSNACYFSFYNLCFI